MKESITYFIMQTKKKNYELISICYKIRENYEHTVSKRNWWSHRMRERERNRKIETEEEKPAYHLDMELY